PAASDQLRATALGVLVMRNPHLTRDQFAFLLSRLAPTSDAVLRQTAARVVGRSTPDRDQLLQIARTRLSEADPLTLSTVLECSGRPHDDAVGEAVITVLRKSPAALTTLGEDRLKRLLSGYTAKVHQQSEPLFQQLRDAQRERIDRLRKLEPL